MYLDSQEEFSNSQAVTATAISTNQLDLNSVVGPNASSDIGTGENMYLLVQVDATATAAGAATVTISLESATDSALTAGVVVHYQSGALALAALTAGAEPVKIKLPLGIVGSDYKRFLGVRYTVATGPLTAGQFSAFLTKDAQSTRNYAVGFSVN